MKRLYETRLGSKFDIVAFHHALLTRGDMPLPVLDRYMEDWAKKQALR